MSLMSVFLRALMIDAGHAGAFYRLVIEMEHNFADSRSGRVKYLARDFGLEIPSSAGAINANDQSIQPRTRTTRGNFLKPDSVRNGRDFRQNESCSSAKLVGFRCPDMFRFEEKTALQIFRAYRVIVRDM